jgi:hypothetical protein
MSKSKDNILSSNDLNNLSPFHQKGQERFRRMSTFRVMSIKLMSQTHVLESMWGSVSNKRTMRFRKNLTVMKLVDDVLVVDLDVGLVTIVGTSTFGCYYAPTRPNSTPSFIHSHLITSTKFSCLSSLSLLQIAIFFIYFFIFILYILSTLHRNPFAFYFITITIYIRISLNPFAFYFLSIESKIK